MLGWWCSRRPPARSGSGPRDHGFWHDELYVAFNLQNKDFFRLAGGLYWNQTAPPGWLMLEKALYELFGGAEHLLRLPQLLAGIGVLVLTLLIARRAVGPWAALLATALAGISPMMLYYAGELKQYAAESCAALLIILCAGLLGPKLAEGSVSRRDLFWFAGVTTAAMGVSYSGLLVLGGALAGLLAILATRRRWRECRMAVLSALPGLALGSFQALLLKRFGTFLPDLDRYFADGMPPRDADAAAILAWLPRMWSAFTDTPLSMGSPAAVLLLVIVGLASLWLRGRQVWAAVFAGVLAAAVGAAAVNGLPMVDRVALYLVAPILILFAAGADTAVRLLIRSVQSRHPGESAPHDHLPAASAPARQPDSAAAAHAADGRVVSAGPHGVDKRAVSVVGDGAAAAHAVDEGAVSAVVRDGAELVAGSSRPAMPPGPPGPSLPAATPPTSHAPLRIAPAWRILIAAPIAALLLFFGTISAAPFVASGVDELRSPLVLAPYQKGEPHPDVDNGRALMREVARQWRPGDVLLSYIYTQPLTSWYGEQYGIPVTGYVDLARGCEQGSAEAAASFDRALAGADRVWYVHLEMLSYHPLDLHAHVLKLLAERGKITSSRVYGNTTILDHEPAWILLDLTAGPDANPPLPTAPLEGCLFIK